MLSLFLDLLLTFSFFLRKLEVTEFLKQKFMGKRAAELSPNIRAWSTHFNNVAAGSVLFLFC